MHPTFSWFEVILLVGVIQGLLTCFFIWCGRFRQQSAILLSLVLLVFSLLCIRLMILTTGLWDSPLFRYFPLPMELAIAPLFWLYIRSITDPVFRFKPALVWHFLPFGLSFLYAVFLYGNVIATPFLTEKDLIAANWLFTPIKNIEDYLGILSAIIYWLLGFRSLQRYNLWLESTTTATDYPTYQWVRNLAILIAALIVGWGADVLLDSVYQRDVFAFTHWKMFFIYLAVLIYWMGFRGYQLRNSRGIVLAPVNENTSTNKNAANLSDHLAETITQEQESPVNLPMDRSEAGEPTSMAGPVGPLPKKERVPREKADEIARRIDFALREEKLYLNPELTLDIFSRQLDLAPAAISYSIGLVLKTNFRQLVNEYRVQAVRHRLESPEGSQFSLAGIAFDCGFNSEASFYRIFRSLTGESPAEYQKRHSARS